MPNKEQLLEQLKRAQQEAEATTAKIVEAEAYAMHRVCRYRECRKEFITDDDRRRYCCPEHYLAENRERTREKNAQRVSKKN